LSDNNKAYRISKELIVTLADVNRKLLIDVQDHKTRLSYEMEIKNRYFGKVMLNCGNTMS